MARRGATPMRFKPRTHAAGTEPARVGLPLTDAIQSRAVAQHMRGRCGGCGTALRIKVRGPTRVRCPVCDRVGTVQPHC